MMRSGQQIGALTYYQTCRRMYCSTSRAPGGETLARHRTERSCVRAGGEAASPQAALWMIKNPVYVYCVSLWTCLFPCNNKLRVQPLPRHTACVV